MTSSRQCEHIRPNGQQCRCWAITGSTLCYNHEPSLAATRAQSRAKGGRARHGREIRYLPSEPIVALNTPADVLSLLESAVADCYRLENSLSRARTIGTLCQVALKAIEVSELAERITALERTVFNDRLKIPA